MWYFCVFLNLCAFYLRFLVSSYDQCKWFSLGNEARGMYKLEISEYSLLGENHHQHGCHSLMMRAHSPKSQEMRRNKAWGPLDCHVQYWDLTLKKTHPRTTLAEICPLQYWTPPWPLSVDLCRSLNPLYWGTDIFFERMEMVMSHPFLKSKDLEWIIQFEKKHFSLWMLRGTVSALTNQVPLPGSAHWQGCIWWW